MPESIEVRSYEIGSAPIVGDYSHAFIVYTNSDGEEFYLRGGPGGGNEVGISRGLGEVTGGSTANPSGSSGSSNGSSNPSRSGDSSLGRPFGDITTQYGPYVPGTVDWGHPGTVAVTVAEGEDLSDVYDRLKEEMDEIEAAGIRYSPLGPNSNSVVATALDNVGIEPRLPEGVNAPGFSMEDLVSADLAGEESEYAEIPPDAYDRALANARAATNNPELAGAEGAAYVAATVMTGLADREDLGDIVGRVLMQSPELADMEIAEAGDFIANAFQEGSGLVALAQQGLQETVEDQIEV